MYKAPKHFEGMCIGTGRQKSPKNAKKLFHLMIENAMLKLDLPY